MDKIPFLNPWINESDIEIIAAALKNGWDNYFYCEEFQRVFAEYHDRKFGLMTTNCTSAIHLVLMALGIGKEDEVIVPECTWIATSAPISYLQATPVFCDIDPYNWGMCPHSLRKKITNKTKAVIAVDLYGNMPHLAEVEKICQENGLYLIEDAAEALGSKYYGRKAGKFGVASVFSFHRTKTLTTGEGGMILSDDSNVFERCSFLRDHGRTPGSYYTTEIAYKYMPSNIQAAIGYAQFQRIDELLARKRNQFLLYSQHLKDIPDINLNSEPEGIKNGFWLPTLVLGESYRMDKEELIQRLAEKNIPSRPFFYPLSHLPAYKLYCDNPISVSISNRGINLPAAWDLTNEQIVYICGQIKNILGEKYASSHGV